MAKKNATSLDNHGFGVRIFDLAGSVFARK